MSEQNPAAPEELTAAMRRAVNDNPSPTASDVLEAAIRLLDQVLRTDCESRDAALDLLTVDALMTQAVAIAGRDEKLIDEFLDDAISRVASRAQD
jgi:Arc/MetJ-type ribon-helix-helix transcriptional regulator